MNEVVKRIVEEEPMEVSADIRERREYVRLLELVSRVGEDWGKVISALNDAAWKGWTLDQLERAAYELQNLKSPINELAGFLEVEIAKKKG